MRCQEKSCFFFIAMILLIMTLKDDNTFQLRLHVMNAFARARHSLTLYQVWKMIEEEVDLYTLGVELEDLIFNSIIIQSGWTRCIWTLKTVETFIYNEASPHGRPECAESKKSLPISGRPTPTSSRKG